MKKNNFFRTSFIQDFSQQLLLSFDTFSLENDIRSCDDNKITTQATDSLSKDNDQLNLFYAKYNKKFRRLCHYQGRPSHIYRIIEEVKFSGEQSLTKTEDILFDIFTLAFNANNFSRLSVEKNSAEHLCNSAPRKEKESEYRSLTEKLEALRESTP